MLDEARRTYPHEDVLLMPPVLFYPVPDFGSEELGLDEGERVRYRKMVDERGYPEESYAVHHWAGTWYDQGLIAVLQRLRVKLGAWLYRWRPGRSP